MGEITIRTASLDDAEAVARVHATSWREAYAHLIPDPDHPAFAVD